MKFKQAFLFLEKDRESNPSSPRPNPFTSLAHFAFHPPCITITLRLFINIKENKNSQNADPNNYRKIKSQNNRNSTEILRKNRKEMRKLLKNMNLRNRLKMHGIK